MLRPFTEGDLRVFAALVLPPVLDGRAIYAPQKRVNQAILSGQTIVLEGENEQESYLPTAQIDVRFGSFADMPSPRRHVGFTPRKRDTS